MKVLVRGNKWVLRLLGATMTLGPVLASAVVTWGALPVAYVGSILAGVIATLAVMFVGVGIFFSTFTRVED